MDGEVARRFVTIQNGDCRLSLYQGYLDPAETHLIFWRVDLGRIVDALAQRSIPLERDLKRDPAGGASASLRGDFLRSVLQCSSIEEPSHDRKRHRPRAH